jgi:hypothetical protein
MDLGHTRFAVRSHILPRSSCRQSLEFETIETRRAIKIFEFAAAICQQTARLSFEFIPPQYDYKNVPKDTRDSLGTVSLGKVNVAVLSDAVDSIARVWLRIWERHLDWAKKQ